VSGTLFSFGVLGMVLDQPTGKVACPEVCNLSTVQLLQLIFERNPVWLKCTQNLQYPYQLPAQHFVFSQTGRITAHKNPPTPRCPTCGLYRISGSEGGNKSVCSCAV
jgi:hypothetical protein